MPDDELHGAEHEAGAGSAPTGLVESRAEVRRALEALLALAASLDELDLDDVEPAFISLPRP